MTAHDLATAKTVVVRRDESPNESPEPQPKPDTLLGQGPWSGSSTPRNDNGSESESESSEYTNNADQPIADESDNDFDLYRLHSFRGFSLWLCPSGASKQAFQELVTSTADELQTVDFLPHITLLPGIQEDVNTVVQRTRRLAQLLAPLDFHAKEVSQRDAYFQCVYLEMKKTPSILQAHMMAHQALWPACEPHTLDTSLRQFVPHMSLAYGDFTKKFKDDTVIPLCRQKMNKPQRHRNKFDTISVDSIQIWSTKGEVEDWYLVETVPLMGKAAPLS